MSIIEKRELEFYLGSLVYPREMVNTKISIYGTSGQVLEGDERRQKLKKAKSIQAALYRYSNDKCEAFFDNRFLSMIFQKYAEGFERRVARCSTMEKNQDAYRFSLKLINRRINVNKFSNFF
jgi:hypothetical protein